MKEVFIRLDIQPIAKPPAISKGAAKKTVAKKMVMMKAKANAPSPPPSKNYRARGPRFVATSPDVPGLVVEGRTIAETMEIAQDVARKIAEVCLKHGDPLPPAFRRAGSRGRNTLVPVRVP